jgi:hypothetical protein
VAMERGSRMAGGKSYRRFTTKSLVLIMRI